jgi:hypothetical protein
MLPLYVSVYVYICSDTEEKFVYLCLFETSMVVDHWLTLRPGEEFVEWSKLCSEQVCLAEIRCESV